MKSEIEIHTGSQKGRGEGLVGGVVTQSNDVVHALQGVQTVESVLLAAWAKVTLL